MDLKIDLRVAELLASRVCHDLVGPIGAVNNGMELMADEDLGMAEDALALTTKSAGQAASVLRLFRLAYGLGGSRQGSDLELTRELAKGFLGFGKSMLDWPAGAAPEGLPEDVGKLILNMVILAAESLPRGGTVGVSLVPGKVGHQLAVSAVGADADLRDEVKTALSDDVAVDELTPRSIQGYFTRLVARRLGADLRAEAAGPGHLRLAVTLPG